MDEFAVRHDPYKSDVYSLGLVFLYMASLKPVKELSSLENLAQNLQRRLSEISEKYPKIFEILSSMLVYDEKLRPNFSSLSKIISGVSEENNFTCPGCGKTKKVTSFKSKENEIMCIECLFTVTFFFEYSMYFLFSFCNICGHIISPEFFCGCKENNKRCIICKCREHPQMNCYEALCVITSSGLFDV